MFSIASNLDDGNKSNQALESLNTRLFLSQANMSLSEIQQLVKDLPDPGRQSQL